MIADWRNLRRNVKGGSQPDVTPSPSRENEENGFINFESFGRSVVRQDSVISPFVSAVRLYPPSAL